MGFMKTARRIVSEWRPDAVVLVDYPSFNLKVAKYAHSLGIPVFYYISPKVWAWKEYRVKQIKEFVTELYSILPFETEFFARHNYHVEYVGNPTVNEIAEAKKNFRTKADFCKDNGVDDKKDIVALLPGSRKKEITDNLKEMLGAVSRFGDCIPVVGGAPGIDAGFYESVFKNLGYAENKPRVLFGKSFELVHHAKAAVVTSGTATLETAVLCTPQVVCFRMGGSKLVYDFYSRLLKVKYVSLPNLIADAPVVKELLLHFCNADNIASELAMLLDENSSRRKEMLQGYDEIARRLTDAPSADTAAERLIGKVKK
jgi:lipid-A-disaccharide synthase